jgi:predicted DNA-binding transcriptional regulator AlpA
MGRRVDIDDLIDAKEVAALLGLSSRNVVSVYQRRYSDRPRPVIARPSGRCQLWSRSEIIAWSRRLPAR